MGEITMNLIRTEKFLHCFSLRAGTLMILWSTLLWFFYAFFLVLVAETESRGGEALFLFLVIVLLCIGELLSFLTLIHFPAPNTTYSPKSRTAKLIKFSAWYYGFSTAIAFLGSFLVASISCIEDHSPYKDSTILLRIACVEFILAAVCIHFMAVIYSFYLSILPKENSDWPRNDVNVASYANL